MDDQGRSRTRVRGYAWLLMQLERDSKGRFLIGTHPHTAVLNAQNELDLERWIVDLAHLFRWRVFAMKDSRQQFWGTDTGFPDLFLVRGERAIAAELKRMHGRYRAGQEDWLAALAGVPGIESYTWRPADIVVIERILK